MDNRVGSKNEPVNPPPLVPRFRVRYIAAFGLMVGGSYNPPLEAADFSAEWTAIEAGFRFRIGTVHSELRAFTISAEVEGQITEPASKDRFSFDNEGIDFRLGYSAEPWIVYAGHGRGKTSSRLTVTSDGSSIDADADYRYWMAGISWDISPLLFSLEQGRSEDFFHHVILSVSYRL